MNPDDLVKMLDQLYATMRLAGTSAGDVLHTVVQLGDAFRLTAEGYEVSINQRVRTRITNAENEMAEVVRVVDVFATKLGELDLRIEHKTGSLLNALPTVEEAFREGQLNLQLLTDLTASASGTARNLWKVYATTIDEAQPLIERRMREWATFMENDLGATEAQIKRAFTNFRFEDAFGEAIEFTWGPDGPIARRATKAASSSPDFGPAMEVLFGSSGKVADSARDAAMGANLDPAFENLEEKLEDGVNTALDKAGEGSAAHAAESLGQKISAGATALGGAISAIPQLHESVTKLGEAWSKPLNSTEDYMNLLSASGAAISQAGQTLQAFSGITQVAAAAQAVFNAVMALNPVVLVVIAVVALIAVIALLIVYWDQVKAALRDNPWLAVAASLFGIIGIIVVIIAYWDEIKLAVLIAANFISIQAQRIGMVFVGLATVIGQVWDWIVATVANVGIAIVNAFITVGTEIQNFFIGVINWVLGKYNELADSALGELIGLEKAELIPEVDVQTRLIPPREVPEINVGAAFDTSKVTGGLEGQIAAQEKVVADAQRADEARRAEANRPAAAPAAAPPGPAGAPATAPGPGLPPLPAGVRPELPPAGAAVAPTGATDQSVRIEGGITVNINAERLEADAAQILSDEIVRKLQERLAALHSEQKFRTGARVGAPA